MNGGRLWGAVYRNPDASPGTGEPYFWTGGGKIFDGHAYASRVGRNKFVRVPQRMLISSVLPIRTTDEAV